MTNQEDIAKIKITLDLACEQIGRVFKSGNRTNNELRLAEAIEYLTAAMSRIIDHLESETE